VTDFGQKEAGFAWFVVMGQTTQRLTAHAMLSALLVIKKEVV